VDEWSLPGAAQGPLIHFFVQTFATKSRAEWEGFLEPIDLCWGAVRSLKDGFTDAHSIQRGMLLRDGQGNPHIGPAIKFAKVPAAPHFDLPTYGARDIRWK